MGPTTTDRIDSRTAIGSITMGIVTLAGVTITTTTRVVDGRAAAVGSPRILIVAPIETALNAEATPNGEAEPGRAQRWAL